MKSVIEQFLNQQDIAIIGVSQRQHNWARTLMHELQKLNFRVFPVNPKYSEIDGLRCFPNLEALPETVENVLIYVNKQHALQLLDDIRIRKIKRVWVYRGTQTPEFIEKAQQKGLQVVWGVCPLMFLSKGIHRFHFRISRLFKAIPRELDFSKPLIYAPK